MGVCEMSKKLFSALLVLSSWVGAPLIFRVFEFGWIIAGFKTGDGSASQFFGSLLTAATVIGLLIWMVEWNKK